MVMPVRPPGGPDQPDPYEAGRERWDDGEIPDDVIVGVTEPVVPPLPVDRPDELEVDPDGG